LVRGMISDLLDVDADDVQARQVQAQAGIALALRPNDRLKICCSSRRTAARCRASGRTAGRCSLTIS
jgi:hypothetical protein